MPFRLDNRCWTIDDREKSKVYNLKSIIFKEKHGFSLIELMVVVSLFGISASLITASYLSFERNQRIKSAANNFKSNLRLIQNSATSGNHGANDETFVEGGSNNTYCPVDSTHTLGGWYLNMIQGGTSYTIGGDCITGINVFPETKFAEKTFSLPKDTQIRKMFYSGNTGVTEPVAIFYRPLSKDVSYHFSSTVIGISPNLDFLDDTSGASKGHLQNPPQSAALIVELSNTAGNKCSRVTIELTGEVNDDNSTVCS
ncbi:MAG: type II secretion system protein [Candidatus Curtissbacteria bacterium]|nr:type II secretion system protein [Candidatus Curtissbacteria bacterium]